MPDLARMRKERFQRLQDQLGAQGVDAVVLLGSSSVAYATGAAEPGQDGDRAALFRSVAVVVKGDSAPHLYTVYGDGVPDELPEDHVHGPLFPDLDDGIELFAGALADHFGSGARIGIDHLTHPILRALPNLDWIDAADVVNPAKLIKTPDEVACIRNAQLLSEMAMVDARQILRPGVRQIDLSAVFLRRVFELGASANAIDPIWQVMAPTLELGPWTLHGDLAYPTVTTDRFLRDGDIIWVDAGITWEGYASDYGRTWITGAAPVPNAKQQAQFRRWRSVVDAALDVLAPGVSALQLGGPQPKPTMVSARGSTTSIWLTASGSTAQKCRSSEPTSVRSSTSGSSCSRGWWPSSSRSSGRTVLPATARKTLWP
jgi:Xaa-Pro dipeptidase